MCVSPIKVKSRNPYNVSFTYVPCGHCRSCRRSQRMQWQSRLFSELDEFHVNRGYNVGFLTLTYQDAFLPHIPRKFFKDGEYEKIPCFSYDDIRRFFNCLRNYLLRKENLRSALRFFLSCEYGEKYHRPHYHAILLFDKRITPEKMYKLCEDAWCGSSQYIPQPRSKKLKRLPLGIINEFADFIPRDVRATGAYCAKYVCKDIAFEDATRGKFTHLSRFSKNHLRHFFPFHKQSIGFGFPLIKDKSFTSLADIYENGFDTFGKDKKVDISSYLNQKLLFVNRKKYNVKSHRYESIKCYSKFFYDNRDMVWRCRFDRARKMFQMYDSRSYWDLNFDSKTWSSESSLSSSAILHATAHSVIDWCGVDDLAYFYATYYGLDYNHCKQGISASDFYFARYDPCSDLSSYPNIDLCYYREMTSSIDFIFAGCRKTEKNDFRTDLEDLVSRVRVFHLNNKYKR